MRRWNPVGAGNTTASSTDPAFGLVLFMAGLTLMTAMDAAVKWLVEDKVHVIQLLFVRSCIITAVLFIFYSSRRQLSHLGSFWP